jgi:hypothetical protein
MKNNDNFFPGVPGYFQLQYNIIMDEEMTSEAKETAVVHPNKDTQTDVIQHLRRSTNKEPHSKSCQCIFKDEFSY